MSPQYGERRPIRGCDRFGSLTHPSKFQWVSRLGFVIAATSLTGTYAFMRTLNQRRHANVISTIMLTSLLCYRNKTFTCYEE